MAQQLNRYIRDAGAKRFRYGESDCGFFSAGWLGQATGRDLTAVLAGQYDDEAAAKAFLKRNGGLLRLARRVADEFDLIETEAPKPGDVGIVKHGRRRSFGILTDQGWALKTERGVVIAPLPHVVAWTARGGGSLSAEAIGALVISFLIPEAAGITILGVSLSTIIGTAIITAATIGVQYALQALNKPNPAQPGQVQQTLRQSIGPRVRHYGTVKTAGTFAFFESKNGKFYRVIVTGTGEIDSVIEHWLNAQKVTLDGSSNIIEAPINPNGKIEYRRGQDSETAYATLTAIFPTAWTAAHNLNGMSSVLVTLNDPGPSYLGKVYPSGIPGYRQVIKAAKVYDPREVGHNPNNKATWTWSDNAGLCILDHLTHSDGYGFTKDDADIDSFEAFADVCDEAVGLKGGGTEKRYSLSGSYSFAEARKDVLQRMLATCDGQVLLLPSGKIGIVGGKYEEPEGVIGPDAILARSWNFFPDETQTANELKPTFTSPDHDYQEIEAAPWRDEDAITRDGLDSKQLSMPMVPSHTQAQRLAKIAGRRLNSPVTGNIKCNLGGLVAFQQRFVRIVDPTALIDGVFLVNKFDFEFSSDRVSVSIDVTMVDPTDWDWDEETEEGDPPEVPEDTSSAVTVETPANVAASVQPVTVTGGVTGGQLSVTWDTPVRSNMRVDVRYRNVVGGVPGPYIISRLNEADKPFLSGVIQNDGSSYEIDVRFIVSGGVEGNFSSPVVTVTAATDAVAPNPVTSLAGTGGVGQIAATWNLPSSTNVYGARVYWNTSNTLTGATLVTTIAGAPSAAQSRTVTGLTAGTRWILVTAINASGIASTVQSISKTVT